VTLFFEILLALTLAFLSIKWMSEKRKQCVVDPQTNRIEPTEI
jgi:hypothetical protein